MKTIKKLNDIRVSLVFNPRLANVSLSNVEKRFKDPNLTFLDAISRPDIVAALQQPKGRVAK